MKLFTFIMAVLVLALSCLPCADTSIAVKDGKSKTEVAQNAAEQDQEHQDACSPFCHCTCCACFTINHNIQGVSIHPPEYVVHRNARYIASLIEISLSVATASAIRLPGIDDYSFAYIPKCLTESSF